jgi:tetratricopeptide (TPR) repeat protein
MSALQLAVDPELRAMSVFSTCEEPNYYHAYLARMLAEGAVVMTTNFDNLIEIACRRKGIPYDLVVTESDFEEYTSSPSSFCRPLIKLHGGYDAMRADGAILRGSQNIRATLPQVGRSYPAFRRTKLAETLSQVFFTRRVVVLGYSGSDDFDIMPALYQLTDVRGMLWMDYDRQLPSPRIWAGSPLTSDQHAPRAHLNPGAGKLIERLRDMGSTEVWAISGDTSAVLDIAEPTPQSRYDWRTVYREWYRSTFDSPVAARAIAGFLLTAAGFFQETVTLFRAVGFAHLPSQTRVICYFMFATALYASGQYDLAIELLSDTVADTSLQTDAVLRACVFYTLSRLFTDLGRYDEARVFLTPALSVFEREHYWNHVADALHQLGLLATQTGSPEQAIPHLENSAAICRELGDLDGVATSLTELATAKSRLGRTAAAEKNLLQAVDIFTLTGSPTGLNAAYHKLALLADARDELSMARSYYERAVESGREGGMSLHLAHSLNNLGDVCARLGDLTRAEQCLLESLAIKESLQDEEGIKITQENLHSLCLLQNLKRLQNKSPS